MKGVHALLVSSDSVVPIPDFVIVLWRVTAGSLGTIVGSSPSNRRLLMYESYERAIPT